MRTIYVAIRGMNYTDRATRQVGRNIDYLVRKQQQMRQAAVGLIAGGIMWMALSAMATMAIYKIIEKSSEGRRAIRLFSRSSERMLRSLGTAFLKVMGPAITMLTKLFDTIANLNPVVLQVMAAFIMGGLALLTYKGLSMALTGALEYLRAGHAMTALATNQTTLTQYGCATSTLTLGAAFKVLSASLGKAVMFFTVFMMLGQILGSEGSKWAAVITVIATAVAVLAIFLWKGAIALSVLTFGLAAAAGLGAIAAMGTPSYQYGTRMVQRTGPAIVHAGDVITRPDRGDITPQQKEAQFNRLYTKAELHFHGDIKTKADKEELRPLILKTLKDALNNKV